MPRGGHRHRGDGISRDRACARTLRSFHQLRRSLSKVLRDYARAAGIQIIFNESDVARLRVSPFDATGGIKRYSPFQNVQAGKSYPPFMLIPGCGERDLSHPGTSPRGA